MEMWKKELFRRRNQEIQNQWVVRELTSIKCLVYTGCFIHLSSLILRIFVIKAKTIVVIVIPQGKLFKRWV